MRENDLLATFTLFEFKTQDQKLKSLVWWEEGYDSHKN